MTRSILGLSPIASTLFFGACTTYEQPDVSDGEVQAVVAVDDLDGNGVTDFGNQSYAFGQTDVGASVAWFFSATLPVNAEDQSYSTFGFGSEEYNNAEFGWETAFLPLPELTNSAGEVVGYGATGIRDGMYEITCGLTSATPYTQNGFCQALEGLTSNDDSRYLATIVNGSPECAGMAGYDSSGYRTDMNWSFMVEGGIISPLGGSFAPPDTACHAQ